LARTNLGATLSHLGRKEEAIAEYREVLRLKPDFAGAHLNLGATLCDQGKFDEGVAEYREALRLKPDLAEAHYNLGRHLRDKGKFDEAIVEYREAARLKPNDITRPFDLSSHAHFNLGAILERQGKLEEAIAEYRESARLKPDLPWAHANLGIALRSRGEFTEAVAELRRARELAKADPQLLQQIERDLGATEQQAPLAARLPAVLAGTAQPTDAAEMLGFAQICYDKKLRGTSARFSAEAFRLQPKLADDLQTHHRYDAACAAALAGCGQGKDDPPLDDAARSRWRKQAIDWLKADLIAWSQILASGPSQARPTIVETLQHWKSHPDLAGLRDPASLDALPKDEQEACRALWKDVDALLAKAGGATP
jgi:tetratricopeptide (TPR) repeat protein